MDAGVLDAPSPASTKELEEFADSLGWYDDATPWRRYFARGIDIFIMAFAIEVMLMVVAPAVLSVVNQYIIMVVSLLAWIPVEGAFLAWNGMTPGKAVLGLRVRQQDGGPLGYGVGLERAGRVWMAGLALGIPVANLIAVGYGYYRLTNRGATWWDDELGLKVESRDMSFGRVIAVVAVLILMGAWRMYFAAQAR